MALAPSKVIYLGFIVLIILLGVEVFSEAELVQCGQGKFKYCNKVARECPQSCPSRCFIDCGSCEPICGSVSESSNDPTLPTSILQTRRILVQEGHGGEYEKGKGVIAKYEKQRAEKEKKLKYEKEKTEKEKYEKYEKEKVEIEKYEKYEKENVEKEKYEKGKTEKEKYEKHEKEKIEKEKYEKHEKEIAEKEKYEKHEKENTEKVKYEKHEKEIAEKENYKKYEKEKAEKDKYEKSRKEKVEKANYEKEKMEKKTEEKQKEEKAEKEKKEKAEKEKYEKDKKHKEEMENYEKAKKAKDDKEKYEKEKYEREIRERYEREKYEREIRERYERERYEKEQRERYEKEQREKYEKEKREKDKYGKQNQKEKENSKGKDHGDDDSKESPTTLAPYPPTSGVKRVRCKNKNYHQCYGQEHVCPSNCASTCEVDCVTCKPVCSCDYPGAVCQDPRFIGGDGITFYFHGKKNKDFCIVSDTNLHINAHFIGKRNSNMTRDFTWVQSLGILFNNHKLFIGVRQTATWDDSLDRLALTLDGEPIFLNEVEGSAWHSTTTPLISIIRISNTNNVMFNVQGLFKIIAKVVPITAEESRIHNYGITEDDCFAHLDMAFKFYTMGQKVDGVLGRTYRDDYVSKVKMGIAMPVVGGEAEYETSSLFEADCSVTRFRAGILTTNEDSIMDLSSLRCASGMDGAGIICKR